MNFAKIKKSYNWVVILDEQSIRRIYSEITNRIDDPTAIVIITIIYSDNSSVDTEKIEDLLNDENLPGRKIKKILLEVKNDKKRILLVFGGGAENHFLEIEGPDRQWIYVTKSILEDRMKDVKESRPRTGSLIFIFLLIIITVSYFISPYFNTVIPPVYKIENGVKQLGIGFLVWLAIDSILLLVSSYFILENFPNLTFLIGREINQHDKRIRFKSNFFWGIIVGIALMFLGIFISKIFKL